MEPGETISVELDPEESYDLSVSLSTGNSDTYFVDVQYGGQVRLNFTTKGMACGIPCVSISPAETDGEEAF